MPRLIAGRFVLRGWTTADVAIVQEASRDPLIPLITSVSLDSTPTAAHAYIARQWDRSRSGAGYSFAIADGETDKALGSIGLWLADIAHGRASTGYWLGASARGRHTAAGSLTALSAWALAELQIPRLELYVEPWNIASIKTAETAGFEREGLLRSWQQVGPERKDMYVYSKCLAGR
jgi:RimJ/RimL family protein N-acetyltransferase